jgi:hypothetical protein
MLYVIYVVTWKETVTMDTLGMSWECTQIIVQYIIVFICSGHAQERFKIAYPVITNEAICRPSVDIPTTAPCLNSCAELHLKSTSLSDTHLCVLKSVLTKTVFINIIWNWKWLPLPCDLLWKSIVVLLIFANQCLYTQKTKHCTISSVFCTSSSFLYCR